VYYFGWVENVCRDICGVFTSLVVVNLEPLEPSVLFGHSDHSPQSFA
jgi:hypothetical protein